MTPNPRDGAENPEEEAPLIKHCAEYEDFKDILPGSTASDNDDELYQQKTPEFKLYFRRWWVLGVFSLLAFMQSFVWITFSSFSVSAKDVFGWTDTTIALLVDWGNVPFIVFVIPICWLLDTKGLRVSTLLSAFLIVLGTGLRCITAATNIATPLIHVGHILNGMAGIIVTGAPAQLSAVWFPAHQRTTATSIAVLTNYLGIAFGYLMGPYFVPHPPMPSCKNITWHDSHPCNNATLTADYIAHEREEVMRLMYYECGAAAVLFLATLIYFPEAPPLPPTASATQERLRLGTTLCKLLRNRSFWVICIGYAVINAVAGNWLGILGPALEPFGITQGQTGLMGMTSTVVGALLSLVLARFVDYLGGKIKLCLIGLLALGCLNFVWYALLYFEVIVPTLERLYPAVIITGIVAYTGTPLYMEMSVEVAYPIQEGVVGIVFQTTMNFMGSIFLALFLIPNIGVAWMNWALIGSTVVSMVLACIQSETYHRSDVDRGATRTNYQAINGSGSTDDV